MKHFLIGVSVLSLVFYLACGSSSNSGGSATVALKNLSSGTAASIINLGKVLDPRMAVGDYGAAAIGSTGLSSYKLNIESISFCESITTTGTAYGDQKNCTTVYSSTAGTYSDILSSTDREALTQQVTLTAGTYNVGIINWNKVVKMTGKVPLGSGQFLYTKTCPSSGACDVSGMASSPAEESSFDSGNGGTWMKFLKPFTVAAGDTVAVDLAFDLEQKLFGGDSVSNGPVKQPTGCSAVASGYCGLYSPILRLQPIPRKTTESTMVETYEMGGVSAEWKLRVDIYYNSADTTKAVLAADIFPIPTTSTNSSVAAGVYVYNVEETGGVTAFKGYDGSNQLSAFTRGDSGSAKLVCPTGAALAGCTEGSEVTVTWTSRTVKTLVN